MAPGPGPCGEAEAFLQTRVESAERTARHEHTSISRGLGETLEHGSIVMPSHHGARRTWPVALDPLPALPACHAVVVAVVNVVVIIVVIVVNGVRSGASDRARVLVAARPGSALRTRPGELELELFQLMNP